MQAFEDLKNDIQTLIDTASDTIQKLVDDAAARARQTPAMTGSAQSGDDGSEFTSQIEDLRIKVRNATDRLKDSARAALENPALSGSGGVGSYGGTLLGSTGSTGSAASTSDPKPVGDQPGLNSGSVQSNNVDDQMPAGGSDQSPNARPTTIGPESFKSGA